MPPSYYDSFLVLSRLCIRSSFLSIVGFFSKSPAVSYGWVICPLPSPIWCFYNNTAYYYIGTESKSQVQNSRGDDHLNLCTIFTILLAFLGKSCNTSSIRDGSSLFFLVEPIFFGSGWAWAKVFVSRAYASQKNCCLSLIRASKIPMKVDIC